MTPGTQLRQARGERNLSLADITNATKIQPWVLEAIEADRLQEMMSPIYVKGFLTSYAKFLHLAPEPLLAAVPWPKPDPVLEDLPPSAPAVPFTFQWPRIPLPLLRRAGAAVAIAGVAAGLIAVNPVQWLSRISLPAVAAPKVAKAKKAEPAAKPAAPTLASVTPVRESVSVPPPPPGPLAAVQPLELSVTAHRTTWIRVRADGKLLTQQRLPRGAKERWTAKKQFELVIANPTQVELSLNGQSISPFAVAHKGRILITPRGVTPLADAD
ncbi:MAG: helix-turn-helix domain-containing protein [Candidatus Omnitrophica bacterium]|nr:helix-turn-helix domain-containing protein [Candidatus Omnitrophota bacterium]